MSRRPLPSDVSVNAVIGYMAKQSVARPSLWPPDVQYITSPRYHASVRTDMRLFLTNGARHTSHPAPPKPSNSTMSTVVRIRSISDASHPARGQFGLFAARKIPPRTHIIDYIGEVHCQDRLDSNYDLSLHRSQDGVNVGVDASKMGNEARFVNDYRGIRCKPNAIFVEYRTAMGELRMSVWSSSDHIQKGDEILVSYGKSWWRFRGDQHGG
ncbi:SET domain protein [Pisolithus orientalis]|uniref:SET domain protein n=1 Tax=Pisolithus orientalis TaxID=936130 RepID=UPI0022247304|nr:SET domain protein [Pisolithus orientalis]KAI6005139.1 SET domain protein [Pisolithus orientalis]